MMEKIKGLCILAGNSQELVSWRRWEKNNSTVNQAITSTFEPTHLKYFFKKGLENSDFTFPGKPRGSKMWWYLSAVEVGRVSGSLSQLEGELQRRMVQLPGLRSPVQCFPIYSDLICGKDENCHKNEDLNDQPLLVIQKHSAVYSTMYPSWKQPFFLRLPPASLLFPVYYSI